MDKSSWDTPRKITVSLQAWVFQLPILTFQPPFQCCNHVTTSTERSLTLKGGEEPSLVLNAVYDLFYSEFAQDLPPKLFFFKSVLDNWFCDNSTLIIRPVTKQSFLVISGEKCSARVSLIGRWHKFMTVALCLLFSRLSYWYGFNSTCFS